MGTIGGQANGDYRLGNSALRILYSLIKDSISSLASDAFTQANPSVQTTLANRSTTLPSTVKHGVLGGSVAFLRPDLSPTLTNVVGGAVLVGGSSVTANCVAGTRPVGLFINDAAGNAYENLPAAASGKDAFLRGGACGVKIYETQVQVGASTALTYAPGDRLYASVNGLLTNRWQDSYEAQWITTATSGSGAAGVAAEPDCTRMGLVLSPPDANSAEMFIELAFI